MLDAAQAREGTGGAERVDAQARPPLPARLMRRLRAPKRPLLIMEIGLIAVSYMVYSAIRNAVPNHAVDAVARAWDLLRFEQSLQIDVELWLNHATNKITWLIVAMNYFYATMHFIVTIGVFVWLYRWHPGRYRPMRTALFVTTALALFGYFFYALAPPRLLVGSGFIDTVVVHNTWGSMASGDLQSLSNQFAAMPSMHAGWSLWCGIAIVAFAQHRPVKILGALYPVATLIVIMATGNHFLLDAVVGWLTLAAGFAIQRLLHGQRAMAAPRHVPDSKPANVVTRVTT